MKKPYRIVIAEDHRILREGLKSILSSNEDIEVVGEADDGLEAIKCTEKLKPDLVLLDISMPNMNGLDAIIEIKSRCPDTKVMVLTMHKADEYIFQSLKSGANGYLLKDATREELILAVKNVLQGMTYISPGVSEKLVSGYLEGRKPLIPEPAWNSLTHRERQILKLIAEGNKNREIGDYLCISVKTVEKHRSNLMKKLDLHNAAELTAFAAEKGLLAD
ncbi:MAG: response regulator transcription factor [Desulfobacterales bacterium]|nr:response regulator transcription factor [Desulfobacteraceae bacterium]MBT4362876.1 response regulator transcription factor [Desulfobacteraceae bacterium]MBT7085921.1 response regulator transcription factor [Desulfobacterales bacterium]MBT7696887.1 response regulator transcription factor [Desulfobacterales bacterium]